MRSTVIASFLFLSLTTTAFAQDEGMPPEGNPCNPCAAAGTGEGMPAEGTPEAMPDEAAPAAKPLTVGADLNFILPLGKWADATGIGIGARVRLDYRLNPKMAITATPGFIYHLPKDVAGIDFKENDILLTAGIRYFITPMISAAAQTGIAMMMVSTDPEIPGVGSETRTRIPLEVGADYHMPTGLYAGAALLIPNLLLTESGEDMVMGIGAHVGWTFMK